MAAAAAAVGLDGDELAGPGGGGAWRRRQEGAGGIFGDGLPPPLSPSSPLRPTSRSYDDGAGGSSPSWGRKASWSYRTQTYVYVTAVPLAGAERTLGLCLFFSGNVYVAGEGRQWLRRKGMYGSSVLHVRRKLTIYLRLLCASAARAFELWR